VLTTGRFSTDNAGYTSMRKHVAAWPERTWAVEGSNGAGRPLAQRLLADGEHVVDVPAKLAARARLFDTGHNRKTDLLTEPQHVAAGHRPATLCQPARHGRFEHRERQAPGRNLDPGLYRKRTCSAERDT
jgi:hypothetical protein